MTIVDTSVWVDAFRSKRTPQTVWLQEALGTQNLGVLDVIACEVLQGTITEREFAETATWISSLQHFAPHGYEFASEVARNYATLRRRGITIRSTLDCWIATFCVQNSYTLLHSDRNFLAFEQHLGLRTVHF